MSVSISYGTQSDIRVQSYRHLNLLRASVFKYERLDILRDYIGHPSQKLLSCDFSWSFSFQLRASRYITGLNRTSELKIILLILHWASVFNYVRLDILRDTIGHPSEKLLSFEFAQGFCFQLRASRYITGLNRTSELKVVVVWLFLELPFSISSVSIYYGTQSDIRVKTHCHLNLLWASVFNYERLDILRDYIGHPSQKLL